MKSIYALQRDLFSPLALFSLFFILLTASAFAQTPVSANGKLKLVGNQLSSECGNPVQLKGMSTHGPQWFPNCYPDAALSAMKNDWGADIFRIAMYVESDGYKTNPTYWRNWIDQMVDKCGQLGIYCLIDWHILSDGDPNTNIASAREFWDYMSRKHAGKKHVLYEICNEPNGVSWDRIKTYAQEIIPIIRANDPETIIIVGTPMWSGTPWDIIGSQLTGSNAYNVMYTFHFYAGSHGDRLNSLKNCLSSIPIFCTEWGTSAASGDGGFNSSVTNAYMDAFNGNNPAGIKVSWCNWSWCDKNEVSAALGSNACSSGSWNNTTQSGTLVKSHMNTADNFIPCGSTGGTAPAISTHPSNQTVSEGQNATFSVTASGTNLSYQWQKDGANIQGATSGTLTLYGVDAADVGSYRVVVTNTYGTVTSNAAQLQLLVTAPSITTHPANQTVSEGQNAAFSVTASGTNLTYQWQKDGVNIQGATSATLTVYGVDAADVGSYRVVVTNSSGTVTSNAAQLQLLVTAPAITTHPANQTVPEGQSATFSVTATGSNLSYQWQKNGANIQGATSATFTVSAVTPSDVAAYRVVVTNSSGTVTSNAAQLQLLVIEPYTGTAFPIPGRIEAEQYDIGGQGYTFNDNTPGNEGTAFRQDAVDIEATGDATGSYNVGYTEPGEWLTYSVNVQTAGSYDFEFRVASNLSGKYFNVKLGNQTIIPRVDVPGTGGWQTYTTVTVPGINLNQGAYTLTVTFDTDAINLNYINVIGQIPDCNGVINGTAFVDDCGECVGGNTGKTENSSCTDCNGYVNGTAFLDDCRECVGGNTGKTANSSCTDCNGVINGSAFTDDCGECVGGNTGKTANQSCTDCNGDVNGTAFLDDCNVCSGGNTGVVPNETCAVPVIGSVSGDVSVSEGESFTLQVTTSGSGPYTYQWFKDGSPVSGATSSTYSLSGATSQDSGNYYVVVSNENGSATSSTIAVSVAVQQAFGGQTHVIPGRIESEDYDEGGHGMSFLDADEVNNGNVYRGDGIDIESTSDAGGGYNVGWTQAGEWMEYSVQVSATGYYDISYRVASRDGGGNFTLMLNDQSLQNNIQVGGTGGWQSFRDLEGSRVFIEAGEYILRVDISAGGFNLNYVDFAEVPVDCNGDPEGTAYYDVCGKCSGGETGHIGETQLSECSVTGVTGTDERLSLRLYPSPAEAFITVELKGSAGKHLLVYNSAGVKVKDIVMNIDKLEVDISGLPSGLYQAVLMDSDEMKSKPFIIK